MSELEVLKGAYGIIQDPRRWTTESLARDAKGDSVFENDPDAVSWCALGAMCFVSRKRPGVVLEGHARLSRICQERFGGSIVCVNNGPDGHAKICEAFRDAIAEVTPPAPAKTPELAHVGNGR